MSLGQLSATARHLLVAALLLASFATTAKAAELVMLVQGGCAWCARWNMEIGPIYPKTSEGRRAPLRVIDIDDPWPQDLASITKERFTPTFVLLEDGAEVGRLRGYGGDTFFWVLLDELFDKLKVEPSTMAPPQT